ncbi:MAG: ABC transporter permease [Acidobacteria bacterium]|nr:ABC transporter permease [Acidobacteriota bacterium]
MSAIHGTLELARAYLLQTMRSRSALIWTLLFPQVWLFLFALIYRDQPGGMSARVPGLFTITAFSGAFFGVAYTLVTEREQGILRRIWVTPATATTVVVANAARSLVTVVASLLVQGILARFALGVDFGPAVWRVAVVLAFGVWAFVPLGLIMGSVAKDMRSAPAIGNLIFMPMIFLSGAALPIQMLPGWLQSFGRMLPTAYLVQALEGVMVRGEGLTQQGLPLAVMLTSGFVAFGLNSLLFRWESTQPLGAKRVGSALAGLALLYVVVALVT